MIRLAKPSVTKNGLAEWSWNVFLLAQFNNSSWFLTCFPWFNLLTSVASEYQTEVFYDGPAIIEFIMILFYLFHLLGPRQLSLSLHFASTTNLLSLWLSWLSRHCLLWFFLISLSSFPFPLVTRFTLLSPFLWCTAYGNPVYLHMHMRTPHAPHSPILGPVSVLLLIILTLHWHISLSYLLIIFSCAYVSHPLSNTYTSGTLTFLSPYIGIDANNTSTTSLSLSPCPPGSSEYTCSLGSLQCSAHPAKLEWRLDFQLLIS